MAAVKLWMMLIVFQVTGNLPATDAQDVTDKQIAQGNLTLEALTSSSLTTFYMTELIEFYKCLCQSTSSSCSAYKNQQGIINIIHRQSQANFSSNSTSYMCTDIAEGIYCYHLTHPKQTFECMPREECWLFALIIRDNMICDLPGPIGISPNPNFSWNVTSTLSQLITTPCLRGCQMYTPMLETQRNVAKENFEIARRNQNMKQQTEGEKTTPKLDIQSKNIPCGRAAKSASGFEHNSGYSLGITIGIVLTIVFVPALIAFSVFVWRHVYNKHRCQNQISNKIESGTTSVASLQLIPSDKGAKLRSILTSNSKVIRKTSTVSRPSSRGASSPRESATQNVGNGMIDVGKTLVGFPPNATGRQLYHGKHDVERNPCVMTFVGVAPSTGQTQTSGGCNIIKARSLAELFYPKISPVKDIRDTISLCDQNRYEQSLTGIADTETSDVLVNVTDKKQQCRNEKENEPPEYASVVKNSIKKPINLTGTETVDSISYRIETVPAKNFFISTQNSLPELSNQHPAQEKTLPTGSANHMDQTSFPHNDGDADHYAPVGDVLTRNADHYARIGDVLTRDSIQSGAGENGKSSRGKEILNWLEISKAGADVSGTERNPYFILEKEEDIAGSSSFQEVENLNFQPDTSDEKEEATLRDSLFEEAENLYFEPDNSDNEDSDGLDEPIYLEIDKLN